jgi:hypothetical protein
VKWEAVIGAANILGKSVISSTVGMGSSSFAIVEDDKQNEYTEGETVKVRGKMKMTVM